MVFHLVTAVLNHLKVAFFVLRYATPNATIPIIGLWYTAKSESCLLPHTHDAVAMLNVKNPNTASQKSAV